MKKNLVLLIISLMALIGCSKLMPDTQQNYPQSPEDARDARRGKLTGEGGLFHIGGDKKKQAEGTNISVNGYLWRAALDTISFMPLSSADPFGGVIITDWYEDPKASKERFKLNILILSGVLRSDAVKVTVFKQEYSGINWRDAAVKPSLSKELEDKILTRARQLRINQPK